MQPCEHLAIYRYVERGNTLSYTLNRFGIGDLFFFCVEIASTVTNTRILNISIHNKYYFRYRDSLSWFSFAKKFVRHLLPNYTINFLPLGHTTGEKPYIENWRIICGGLSKFVIPYNDNWDLNQKNYIVLITKARDINELLFNSLKNALFETLNRIGLPIVLLGEKELPKSNEYTELSNHKSVFSFYNDALENLNNVLVIDNEGNFVDNLKDFPEILDGVRLLQIEHDFNSEEDIQFFYSTMKQNNFKMTDKFLKTERFGPGINWFDGIRTDPIFVSVWEK